MLELWEPDHAFHRIETYLDEAGFFRPGAVGLVADLYLGYGLGRAQRRTAWADPPEPCRLPLAACRVRPAEEPPATAGPHSIGEWEPTWDEDEYAAAVTSVRAAIEAGDVYQVNLVQHLSAPFRGDPSSLARALAPLRPVVPKPLSGDGWTIVSASPELFLARRGSRVFTMPIKGTSGDLELALTIRTFAVADGRVHLWVGGGIVWDSDPHDEIEESWVKARPLLAAIGAPRMAEVNA